MNGELIKAMLIEIIRKIQTDGGYDDADQVADDTVPLDGLKGFDSKLGPIATRRLARALDIEIPKKLNIFRERGRTAGRKLSIAEIAAAVAATATEQTEVAK